MRKLPILVIIAVFSACMTMRLEAKISFLGRIFQGRGMEGGTVFTLGVDEQQLRELLLVEKGTNITEEVIQREIEKRLSGDVDERILAVVRRRIEGMEFGEAVIQGIDQHRFRVQLPGTNAAMRAEVRRTLQSAAYLEFRLAHPRNIELCRELMERMDKTRQTPEGYVLRCDGFVRAPNYYMFASRPGYKFRLSVFGNPPQGYQFMLERDRYNGSYTPNFIRRKAELTGRDFVSAHVERDELGRVEIAFKLNDKGAQVMRKISSNNIDRQLAIIIDGEIISAPILKSEIGASGLITGSFTMKEAKRLANDLNAGALPVPLMILAEEIIPPKCEKATSRVPSGSRPSCRVCKRRRAYRPLP